MSSRRRIELGCAGHLTVGHLCRWRRHTQIDGKIRVSTVGNYHPDRRGKRETVGYNRYFETMVFRLTEELADEAEGCGCHEVEEWCEIDFEGYNTAGEAQAGHERMVRRWMRKLTKEAP